MNRPSFNNLGFDPAPGDLQRIEQAAQTMRHTVAALGEVEGVLTSDRDGEWMGKAAEAFRSMVGEELAPRVTKAYSSFDDASRALTDWVNQLVDFQRRADTLEARAREARADVTSAQNTVDALPDIDDDAPDADDARAELKLSKGKVTAANAALSSVLFDARTLSGEVEEAAGHTAGRLDDSAGAAPDEPGLFDRIGDFLADIGDFLVDLAGELIEFLDEILPVLIFVLAIASIFLPVLGPIVLGLSILAIAIDTGQAIAGTGSWSDVIVGLACLGAGAVLGHLAKGFAAAHANAFRIGIGGPGIAMAGGGIVPGSAAAVIKFYPTVSGVAGLGWASAKLADLQLNLPPALRPAPKDDDDK